MSEEPARIRGIFRPVLVDLPGPNTQPWLGVVERISFSEETGRVTIELSSADEFHERTKALDRLDGGQTFAEATAGVPDAVKQAVAGVGVSMAEAARILRQYGQAWRESLARDQCER